MYQLYSMPTWISVALACAVVCLIAGSETRRRSLKLPPGPQQLPIVGNVHQIPQEYQERTFAQWAQKYGDLVYARLFTRPVLIINSQKIARELLDKRGKKYSSRSRMVMMCELLGWDPALQFLAYDDERRLKQRRWLQSAFGDKATIAKYDNLREREACILLAGLIHTPHDFARQIKRYVSALIVESVYGHQITTLDDEYIDLIERAMDATGATGPAGGTIVDYFPLLKYVPAWAPGMAWKRRALRARGLVSIAISQPYAMSKEAVAAGTARPSLISALLEDAIAKGQLAEEEEDIRNTTATVYGAGTDTGSTMLLTFILAMVLHPDVYQKAQEEVDRVIGRDRLPTLADKQALPYLDCVLKEVYRWNPPVPLGIPHHLTEDDEYQGFDLPKNTGVIANLWSMTHSEEVYGDPAAFRPERFLELDPSTQDESDPRNIVFGHGRRACPGRLFAEAAVFLAISNIIATLDIKKARDPQGREITPEPRFVSGFVSHPHDFVCDITPRSPEAVHLVSNMVASVC